MQVLKQILLTFFKSLYINIVYNFFNFQTLLPLIIAFHTIQSTLPFAA